MTRNITHLTVLFYRNPSVYFPCMLDISPEAMKIFTQIERKKDELLLIEGHIEKATNYHQKCLHKFERKEKKYKKLMDRIEPMAELLEPKPEIGTP